MDVKLKFEDFKLDSIQEIRGGQPLSHDERSGDTQSDCTWGDVGCCDNVHLDDNTKREEGYGYDKPLTT